MTERDLINGERPQGRSLLTAICKWTRDNGDILKAYVIFIGVTALGFAIVLLDWSSGYFLDPINNWTASCSGFLINLFGGHTYVLGSTLGSNSGAVSIREGCNAVYATIIYIAAVLAFPTTLLKRIVGVVLGSFALFAINLIRIITLLYLNGYNAKLFEEAHLHIWQFAIILIGGLLRLLWYDKIVRRPSHAKNL